MAAQEPYHISLPSFYGERMQDDTVVQRPSHQGSRDALLRLPIQQPGEAHISNEPVSPTSPTGPAEGLNAHSGISKSHASKRQGGGNHGRYFPFPPNHQPARERERERERESDRDRDRDRDYQYPSRRHGLSGYQPSDWPEEYYEEDDRPRPYRRPSRRHIRPPQTHQNMEYPGFARGERPSREYPRRSSEDYRIDHDTPTKPYMRTYYGSDEEDPRYRRYAHYPGVGGAGGRGRGPPGCQPTKEEALRLPWTMWMNSDVKNHFVAFIGEFVGTSMFLFFAFSGTQVANIGSKVQDNSNTTTGAATGFSPSVLQYIALVFGFSLMVNVWIFFRISGGLFNPAVTFAMLLTRTLGLVRFALLLVAQLAGSIFSSYLVSVMFPTPLNVRTTLSAGTSLARGVFIEAVLTAELVFTIFMLAKEKHKATFIAPVGIGLALFIGELVGVYYTGGSLNPARSFGPCVVNGIFDREHWIYWVGPGIGAILAVAFYKFIKILEYEMANPGQDDDDKDQEMKEQEQEQEAKRV